MENPWHDFDLESPDENEFVEYMHVVKCTCFYYGVDGKSTPNFVCKDPSEKEVKRYWRPYIEHSEDSEDDLEELDQKTKDELDDERLFPSAEIRRSKISPHFKRHR